MAIKISYNDPRAKALQEELPYGVTFVPVVDTKYKDHYQVWAHNYDYPDRTEIGTVKRTGEGYMVCSVRYHKWDTVSGFRVCDKSYGEPEVKDIVEAINSLYAHRLHLKAKGLLTDE